MTSFLRADVFRGMSALVTGGGTGIGRSIAIELRSLGAKVTIASRSETNLRKTGEENDMSVFRCDIRREGEVKELMQFVENEHGGLDLLVCNAGGQFHANAEDISAKGWNAVIDTNLNGSWYCMRHGFELMKRTDRGGGAVVNIIADMFNGFPGMAHTGAARAAVENLTKTLALEWIHEGVRVNAVAPGLIYSSSAARNYPPGFLESFSNELPAKRLGTPGEVSSAVCFLLSPAAKYITGTTLRVDGGSSLYRRVGFHIKDHKQI